ncbi:DUF3177 family protein [Prochlorococcus sp. MIT 1223]|uniref:DUF3177 family protein n=1 Tax=Prochlorococcus sp. MIT 1223 TaxID=3096217 RepID=UPI002A754EC4|nr:DUF3177 family protein [Prochlorococcus sp. MIT 1223]
MTEIQYRTLVWLAYRLAATFAFGLPLVLLIWSSIKKEQAISRLLSIYWKVSSLIFISILLLTSNQPIGYIASFFSLILSIVSIWFWVDLNEEIGEMPLWKPLPLATKVWRWGLSFLGILYVALNSLSLKCFQVIDQSFCNAWIIGPQSLHETNKIILRFLFGGSWSQSLAGVIGYLALIIYIIGLIQWLLIRLPKHGRIAGEF